MPKQNEKAGTVYNILKALGRKCVMKSDFEKTPIWKMCFLSREGLNIFFLKDNKIKGIFEPFISSIPRRQTSANYSTGKFGAIVLERGRTHVHSLPAVMAPSCGPLQKWR